MPKDKFSEQKKNAELLWASRELIDKVEEKFFGKVEIYFEEGRIRRMVVEESKMPPT